MNAKRVCLILACMCVLAGAAAADEAPSLEIVTPQEGREYDGGLTVELRLRRLPPRRLLVRIYLGEVTHCFVVDPRRPPQDLRDTTEPAWIVRDRWLLFAEGPQRMDVTAFYREEAGEPLFQESVEFTIKPATLNLAEKVSLREFADSAFVAGLERELAILRASGDPAAEARLQTVAGRLVRYREGGVAIQIYLYFLLSEEYVRALRYDRALGCLQRADEHLIEAVPRLSSHPLGGTADWRRRWSTLQDHPARLTDMYVRLAQFDAAVESCRREIVFAAEMHMARTGDRVAARGSLVDPWTQQLSRSLERMGMIHMLLYDDETAYDEWRAKADEFRARKLSGAQLLRLLASR